MAERLEVFRQEDADQMKRIEEAIHAALAPFAANTDPLLAVLALTRVLSLMLHAAKKKAVEELLPILFAYLMGKKKMPGQASSMLWTPGNIH